MLMIVYWNEEQVKLKLLQRFKKGKAFLQNTDVRVSGVISLLTVCGGENAK